jgi:ATP-dependent DNA ligase
MNLYNVYFVSKGTGPRTVRVEAENSAGAKAQVESAIPEPTTLPEGVDLRYLNGEDLMRVPLVRRREILKRLLPKEGPMRFSDAIEGHGKEFSRVARERGLEGIIAKKKDSIYLPGKRSDNWLKIKARMQQEAVIGGITEGEGWRKHLGALMLECMTKASCATSAILAPVSPMHRSRTSSKS